ncbi:circadian clock protein KaiC [Anopheles sinensis]|uniref:Circadian clock protein KaiC n=1 Tax=Anopheles sinensis TaxID=74873 RepID=A0A084VTE5_ANOSI|nr:circadian clock protein KaiC [Anopheles sinensis]
MVHFSSRSEWATSSSPGVNFELFPTPNRAAKTLRLKAPPTHLTYPRPSLRVPTGETFLVARVRKVPKRALFVAYLGPGFEPKSNQSDEGKQNSVPVANRRTKLTPVKMQTKSCCFSLTRNTKASVVGQADI